MWQDGLWHPLPQPETSASITVSANVANTASSLFRPADDLRNFMREILRIFRNLIKLISVFGLLLHKATHEDIHPTPQPSLPFYLTLLPARNCS